MPPKKYKILPPEDLKALRNTMLMLLHAGRDWMRNQKTDTSVYRFEANDPYRAECFGILRALQILGYGNLNLDLTEISLSPKDSKWNLRKWLGDLEDEVLIAENFGGNNECDYCVEKFGKDGAKRTRGLKLVGN